MTESNWRGWLLWVSAVPCLAGCQGLFATQGPPQDPLFVRRQPMQAKAELLPPAAVAYSAPTMPRDPFHVGAALAQRPDRNDVRVTGISDPPTPEPRSVPGILTNRPSNSERE